MEIPTQYNPTETEDKWYQYWMQNRFFNSSPNEKPAYTIVIPPPNVTGVLHMGHMLNNTLQDVLIRRARMNGFNACWVPGTDHASIATEAKVVNRLKEQGISKDDLTREEFLKHAWNWTDEHGGIILEQLKKLGASCDWDRTKFTLDKNLSESVTKVFVELYEKGLIYRGYRMVNWDPEAKTTLSDEEVIYIEKQGKLYHVQYQIEGSDEYITIATTRPETILGDTAVCVNPNDERYKHLAGKNVIVPIANRTIPIIQDDYVDMEFGTGCLKITPAHDVNDKEIGERHHLEVIDIFNEDATLNANGLHYQGKDRFVVRKEIEKELSDINALVKIEDYTNKVGTSERTKAVIEPRISVQWFLKMETIAKKALEVVENGEIKFYPQHYINTYRHWLENIRDWNISRQLWWGHRIPAYYYGERMEDFVVAETDEKALELAQLKTQNSKLKIEDLKQDEDALDTWFSSWLWPISVFDGINHPDNEEINYYYPTSDLVTGPDIIFFWVARMIMAGNEFRDQIPFKNVYFTGIVRDKQRRKMSKSLGNSPDPIELMKQYGADGVRVGVLLSSSAGSDLMFDEDLCLQGRNFSNKIWNAFRLIKGWNVDTNEAQPANAQQGIEWFENKLNLVINQLDADFNKFRISDALMKLYKLVWDDFCSSFLEIIKPTYGKGIDSKTLEKAIELFEKLMQLLHPFMPFLTEEIWQHIEKRDPKNAITISTMPKASEKANEALIKQFEEALHIVSNIRTIRKDKQISFKDSLTLVKPVESNTKFDAVIEKLTNVQIDITNEKPEGAFAFRVEQFEYFVPLTGSIDVEAEKAKLTEELNYQQGFLKTVEKKLSNEKFVNGAPEQVVANEHKKKEDALAKIKTIEESLANL
ncbi:valine--tRNA ligase [Flavobacteriaceae bacterium UJ101]|nr:valine--tRNA ligase [Flavobacteriaceae bacterium UJ101]